MDDRQMLYPNIDFARQNFHANKTAIKPKTLREKRILETESQTASTAATSTKETKCNMQFGAPHKGVTIAKISDLNDMQLERLLRAQFRRNVHAFTQNVIRDIRYNVVDKNVHGPVIKPKATESRLRIEKEWQQIKGPSVMSYAPRDEVTRANVPEISFPKQERMEKSPRGDFRRPLSPNLDAVRKVAPKVKIAPEHEIVESEFIKAYIETKGGPATYTPSFKLVEARPDVGVRKIVKDYFEKIEEVDY